MADADAVFSQAPYAARLVWGTEGAAVAARRGDVVIVVDVLRFSSTAVTALAHGAEIMPHPGGSEATAIARRAGATLLRGRGDAPDLPSLSPTSFGPEQAGRRYVLCSPNGAACAYLASAATAVFVGCLLNARAAAATALRAQRKTGAPITVVACGERGPADEGGGLRPCIEDYLGAGAILSALGDDLSPEAEVCRNAFAGSSERLSDLLWDCASGRELRARGAGMDVYACAQRDRYDVVPQLREGSLVHAVDDRPNPPV